MSEIHDQPSVVGAENGIVTVDGPDGVAVALTPEAAIETAHRLYEAVADAATQQGRMQQANGQTKPS